MSKFDLSRFRPDAKLRILEEVEKPLHFVHYADRRVDWFDYEDGPDFVRVKSSDDLDLQIANLHATKKALINVMVPLEPKQTISYMAPRKHRKRSGQTEASHQRIQKKWDKRGLQTKITKVAMKPAVMVMNLPMLSRIRKQFGTSKAKLTKDVLTLDMDALGYRLRKRENVHE